MGVQLGDLGDEKCHVVEQLLDDEFVMRSQVPAQSLLQLGNLSAQPTLGQLGQLLKLPVLPWPRG